MTPLLNRSTTKTVNNFTVTHFRVTKFSYTTAVLMVILQHLFW